MKHDLPWCFANPFVVPVSGESRSPSGYERLGGGWNAGGMHTHPSQFPSLREGGLGVNLLIFPLKQRLTR
jgi:hypothetical protein